MNTYSEALDWIHSRLKFGVKLGLARMDWMLEKLGHPERNLKVIHVGGTNGKGSTVTLLRSILNEAGYQVGTFTSPYIEQFNERISVNGKPISNEEIVSLVNLVQPLTEEMEDMDIGAPTEFEVITVMAICYFSKLHQMDFTIIEVGMGGRYDSTNVLEPLLSIITNIGMDHTHILGNTIEKIAYEKAGILKEGVPLFTAASQEEALAVIVSEVKKKGVQLNVLEKDFFITRYEPSKHGETFTFSSRATTLKDIEVALLGEHQTKNAALVIASLLHMNDEGVVSITEKDIRNGLKAAYWPGRLEVLSEHPTIMIDGAHNPEGLRAFERVIHSRYEGKKIHLVFAALGDKDLVEIFSILKTINANVYFTQFDFPRVAQAETLKELSGLEQAHVEKNWETLLHTLLDQIDHTDMLVVVGSLYFIAQVKPFLQNIINERFL